MVGELILLAFVADALGIGLLYWRLHQLAVHQRKDTILIMATLADLDAEIAGDLTAAVTSIETTVTTLEQKIAAGVDTSSEIASLKSLAAGLNAAVAGTAPVPAPIPPAGG